MSYWFLLNLYMPFAKYFISEWMFPLGTDVFWNIVVWNNSKLCKEILERYNFTAIASNFMDFSVLKVLFFIPLCRFNLSTVSQKFLSAIYSLLVWTGRTFTRLVQNAKYLKINSMKQRVFKTLFSYFLCKIWFWLFILIVSFFFFF